MSDEHKKPEGIAAAFRGLVDRQVDGLTRALEGLLSRRSKHRHSQRPVHHRRRRRQGKAARRARRYNRRPTKRPKGRRKP